VSGLILRPVEARDTPELRRIHSLPEVIRWWDAPEDGFPESDDSESTRFVIEVDGVVAGLIQFGEEETPNTGTRRSTSSSTPRSTAAASARKPCGASRGS